MPHGMCYDWNSQVIWLHVISDALIALAYYSIPITLLYFVRKRKDLVFDWIFVCFALFIVACGTTHLMEILNIWHPVYWLSGIIKAITALLSVVTAILLIKLIPQALRIPSPEQLRATNQALQKEVQERTKAFERIESLNGELVRQTANLESSNKELETFSYSVSHDLRAPLRHIDGYIHLLTEEAPDLGESGGVYAKKIAGAATQMGLLIDNLLAFSQTGKAALQQAWIDTAAMVDQVREELAPDLKNRVIEWKIDELPRVYMDRALFKQVWTNLIGNAIKYTRDRNPGRISIGCRVHGDDFEFSIQDNGAGFDMRHVDKLFGIFQRLHLRHEFEGTGIGLANVQRIIARHGGKIWGKGEVGVGASFFFTVPRNQTA